MIASMMIPPDQLGTPPMSDSPFSLLPRASNHAAALDNLYIFLTVVTGVSFVLVIGVMVYFMVKYKKRGDDDVTNPLTHNGALEFWWSAIPALILMVIFVWGEIDFMKMSAPPSDAININITGQKWKWSIEYPEHPGSESLENDIPTLIVPLHQQVKLTMTSTDVIHSFYVPAFRVKKDVIPGRYTTIQFIAIEEGEFPVFCAEYCGDEHSSMLAKVVVVKQAEYAERVAEANRLEQSEIETVAQFGQRVYNAKGCAACHSLDGTPSVGPSFAGIWGKSEQLSDGSTVTVDENYIVKSLKEPNAQLVEGFAPQMPTYAGKLTEPQTRAIIELIKSIGK